VRLAAEGRFEKYTPENAAKISEVFRNIDPNGFFHTTSSGQVVLSYNTTKVKAEEAPKAWKDLLDPKWKGKVSTGHPAFSGYVRHLGLLDEEAVRLEVLHDLEKNKPQIGRSINDTVTALNAGERQVAAGADGSTLFSAARGNPLAVNYPTDGSILIVAPSAIVKGTKHPQRRQALHGVPDDAGGLGGERQALRHPDPPEVKGAAGTSRSTRSRSSARRCRARQGHPRSIETARHVRELMCHCGTRHSGRFCHRSTIP
jgi:hypothetical protein